jgi:release factor glutamine methyltransferase
MATIRDELEQATVQFTETLFPIDNPRLDARLLLAHVLEQEPAYLYTHPEYELNDQQSAAWQDLLTRRLQGEPVAYLLGQKAFYGLDFAVDRRVLIPRPETELLVEQALKLIGQRLNRGETPLVADIGTGSGAIPISLAIHEPRLPAIYAVDISAEALEVARSNCQLHQVAGRVRLLQGDLLDPLPEPVDLLLANLPYVGTGEQNHMQPDVLNYEPHLALFSGHEGLDLLYRLLDQARHSMKLRPGAVCLLETGYQHRGPLTSRASELWPEALITWRQDYAGWDRLLQIELPALAV